MISTATASLFPVLLNPKLFRRNRKATLVAHHLGPVEKVLFLVIASVARQSHALGLNEIASSLRSSQRRSRGLSTSPLWWVSPTLSNSHCSNLTVEIKYPRLQAGSRIKAESTRRVPQLSGQECGLTKCHPIATAEGSFDSRIAACNSTISLSREGGSIIATNVSGSQCVN